MKQKKKLLQIKQIISKYDNLQDYVNPNIPYIEAVRLQNSIEKHIYLGHKID